MIPITARTDETLRKDGGIPIRITGGPTGTRILRYVEWNRVRQRERRAASRPIAKTDAWKMENHIIPGRYQLVPLGPGTVAKTDAINVEIRVVPRC